MPSSLKNLRVLAGYDTAKEFAAAVNVPEATYNRYEATPEKIPIERAWVIADKLGCSIDAVVGHGAAPSAPVAGGVQRRYDALSPASRRLVDDILEFAEQRDAKAREQLAQEERFRYRAIARNYEAMFLQQLAVGSDFGEFGSFTSPAERRSSFESFVRARADAKRSHTVSEQCEEYFKPFYLNGFTNGAETVLPTDPRFKPEMERMEQEFRASKETEIRKADEEVITKIMGAYDELQAMDSRQFGFDGDVSIVEFDSGYPH